MLEPSLCPGGGIIVLDVSCRVTLSIVLYCHHVFLNKINDGDGDQKHSLLFKFQS